MPKMKAEDVRKASRERIKKSVEEKRETMSNRKKKMKTKNSKSGYGY